MEEENITPAPEVIEQEPVVEETVVETLGDIVAPKEIPKVENVPMARLNKEINRRKELEREIAELKANPPKSAVEINASIKQLAEEHNVDPEFLDKFAASVRSQLEDSFDERLRPLTEKKQAKEREDKFTNLYNKTLAEMPEFGEVVNGEVIKQLAFNPANANKTLPQLLEETYGKFVVGKKSIETTTPRGGGNVGPFDYNKAVKDTAYFKEVMANPELKAKYNEEMLKRY